MNYEQHGLTWNVRQNTHDELIIKQAVNYFGRYDVQPGWTVIDIGAHIGAFARLAAQKGATVYAFEPEPENFDLLKRNTVGVDVRAFRNAVTGIPGNVTIYKWEKSPGNTGSYSMHYGKDGESFRAWGITLAEALILAGGACDLLKCDCEGAEYDIFMNARPETLRAISRITMEWHIAETKARELDTYLRQCGFTVDYASNASGEKLKSGELYQRGKLELSRGE